MMIVSLEQFKMAYIVDKGILYFSIKKNEDLMETADDSRRKLK